jgi:hypothetical protein
MRSSALVTFGLCVTTLLAAGCPGDPAASNGDASTTGMATETGDPATTSPVTLSGTTLTADDTTTTDPTNGTTGGGTGDCCDPHGTPGCDVDACEVAVCAMDQFCCTFEWDADCAAIANDECTGCGGGTSAADSGSGSDSGGIPTDQCCDPTPGVPGCAGNPAVEMCVCDADPFCCMMEWDAMCSAAAEAACGADCGGGGGGDCCAGGAAPGCDDPLCEADVCAVDAFCCANTWDDICASEAAGICDGCGAGMGDCCVENAGEQGCTDDACVNVICGEGGTDPSCCTVEWTQACADAAVNQCGGCGGGGGGGDCCAENGSPGCDDATCETDVCAVDPFCCSSDWDLSCANMAAGMCGVCGAGEGDCCLENAGEMGCADDACIGDICGYMGVDPTCCTTEWTQACADAANANCTCP